MKLKTRPIPITAAIRLDWRNSAPSVALIWVSWTAWIGNGSEP